MTKILIEKSVVEAALVTLKKIWLLGDHAGSIANPSIKDLEEALAKQEQSVSVGESVAWRELCRRLYVELLYCDQQMTAMRDDDGNPMWWTGKTISDVLIDAKQALDTSPVAQPKEQNKPLGTYEHRCPQVTGHRGPSFVCQKAGHGVSQDSYCRDCTCPDALKNRTAQPKAEQDLLSALKAVQGTLIAANEQGQLADTIWFSKYETLFDFIEAEIVKAEKNTQPAQPKEQA